MNRTKECLKKYGIIDRLQDDFNNVKPPKGTSDETINCAIEDIICLHMKIDDSFADEIFDAMMKDAVDLVRNELKIEYGTGEDLINSAIKILALLKERKRG